MGAVWKTAVEMLCTAITRGFESHPLYIHFLLALYEMGLPFLTPLIIINIVKKSREPRKGE